MGSALHYFPPIPVIGFEWKSEEGRPPRGYQSVTSIIIKAIGVYILYRAVGNVTTAILMGISRPLPEVGISAVTTEGVLEVQCVQ